MPQKSNYSVNQAGLLAKRLANQIRLIILVVYPSTLTIMYTIAKTALLLLGLSIALDLKAQEIVTPEEITCIILKSESEQAGQLCDAYNQLMEFNDYKAFAEGFVKDLEEKKEPRKAPEKLRGGKTLIEQMKLAEEAINKLVIPGEIKAIYRPYPALDRLGSQDLDIRTKATTDCIWHIKELSDNFKNYKLLKTDLETYRSQVDMVKQASNQLKEDFFEIMESTGSGTNEISSIFGFAALDIVNHISPTLGSIRSITNERIKDAENLLSSSRPKFDILRSNTRLIITATIEFLDAKAKEKNTENSANFKKVMDFMEKNNPMIDNFKEEVAKTKKAEFDRLTALSAEVKEMQARFIRLDERIERKKKELKNFKFTTCPNQKTFEACDHLELKNEYTNSLNALKQEYNELVNRRPAELAATNAKTTTYNKGLDEQKIMIARLNKEVDDLVNKTLAEFEEFKKAHVKSKEELYKLEKAKLQTEADLTAFEEMKFD